MSLIRDAQERVTRSGLLAIVVERDFEYAPDDKQAWLVVLACDGETVPKHFGGGYLHVPGCDCMKDDGSLGKNCGRLCDVGWLKEFVSCVGAWPLVRDIAEKEDRAAQEIDRTSPDGPIRLRLIGRMVSERFETQEGTDYDERFDVERAEVVF